MTSRMGRSPGRQRLVAFLAVLSFAVTTAVTLGVDRHGNHAEAALPDGPFSCGANDQNRQGVQMWNGSMGSSAYVGWVYPCLSGTQLTLTIPAADNSATISSVSRLKGPMSITLADGSTISNVYQLGFRGFTVNPSARGVTLQTTAGTGSAHRLRLAPDAGAVFGGGDVVTDLLVTGDSQITINDMPLSFFGTCGLLGGSGSSTCTVQVQDMSQSLVEFANLIGITTFQIRQMDLKIYYIVTHNASGGTPSGAAFQFPDTTITAGDVG